VVDRLTRQVGLGSIQVERKFALDERVKIHELVMEGIDAVLRRRSYLERLKTTKKR
jgi:hypothetical protein